MKISLTTSVLAAAFLTAVSVLADDGADSKPLTPVSHLEVHSISGCGPARPVGGTCEDEVQMTFMVPVGGPCHTYTAKLRPFAVSDAPYGIPDRWTSLTILDDVAVANCTRPEQINHLVTLRLNGTLNGDLKLMNPLYVESHQRPSTAPGQHP